MSQLVFNTSVGIQAPSTKEIRDDLAGKFQACFQTSPTDPLLNVEPTSPMGQILDLVVAEIEAKNAEIMFLSNMVNPNTSTGRFLDAIASLYGIDRKVSEPTVVTCVVTGLKGTLIPYGAIAQDTEGNQYRHVAQGGITIGSTGQATTSFVSVERAPIEVGENSLNQIVTVISGWDSITNPSAGIVGRTEETDSELRNRIFASYAINGTGYVEAVYSNLNELEGVLDCRVLENYTDQPQQQYGVTVLPHSIAVCIVGGEDLDIARIIYQRKDAGCGTTGDYKVTYTDTDFYNATYTYNIIRPQAESFKMTVEFFVSNMNETEQEAVKNAIVADFNGQAKNERVRLASTVYASRFYSPIMTATDAPVKSVQIALNSGTLGASVDIPANIEPAISADNITLVFAGD